MIDIHINNNCKTKQENLYRICGMVEGRRLAKGQKCNSIKRSGIIKSKSEIVFMFIHV